MDAVLDPAWPLTRPVLWVALAVLLALLVVRAIRRDRREYQRFKRYRTTKRRQVMLRRWLLESFLSFGGLTAVMLLLAGGFVAPLLAQVQAWTPVRYLREAVSASPVLTGAVLLGLVLGLVGLTAVGVAAARQEGEVPAVGDIRALLPRNRQELVLGGLLSVNAGVVEELAFRFALPALLFGASGDAVVAVVGSVVVFGLLHLYQGVPGIIGSTVVGVLFMAAFVLTGSIVVPIVLHALFDLRSLVLIPVAVYEAHRIDGRVVRVIDKQLRVPRAGPAEPASDQNGGGSADTR
ncbi:MAG TPA: type II CAAX endopeptidase family protein [Rhodoglobus sp.]|nr:type II CAAX endopeptidase family protein [Rhodoglobus sp.]